MGRQGTRGLLGAGKGPDHNLGDHFLGEHLNICPGTAHGTQPLSGHLGCVTTTELSCCNLNIALKI